MDEAVKDTCEHCRFCVVDGRFKNDSFGRGLFVCKLDKEPILRPHVETCEDFTKKEEER